MSLTERLLLLPGRLKWHLLSFAIIGSYDICETQPNATLTGQEEEGDVQLKVS